MQTIITFFPIIAGAVAGTLLGIAGGTAGDLAKKGKPIPSWVSRMFSVTILLGILTIVAGIVGTVLYGNGFMAIIVGGIVVAVTHNTKRGMPKRDL